MTRCILCVLSTSVCIRRVSGHPANNALPLTETIGYQTNKQTNKGTYNRQSNKQTNKGRYNSKGVIMHLSIYNTGHLWIQGHLSRQSAHCAMYRATEIIGNQTNKQWQKNNKKQKAPPIYLNLSELCQKVGSQTMCALSQARSYLIFVSHASHGVSVKTSSQSLVATLVWNSAHPLTYLLTHKGKV